MKTATHKSLALIAITTAATSLFAGENPNRFTPSSQCVDCHERQHNEWRESAKASSATSPVYQALELTVRKMTGRFGPHDGDNPTFCTNCHSPVAAYQNEMIGVGREEASIHGMSATAREGITCAFCHNVRGPRKFDIPDKGFLGDGLANASVSFYPSDRLVGPTENLTVQTKNGYHTNGFWGKPAASQYLTSSQFCGACHNVNLPMTDDLVEQTSFQKEQTTFTEWSASGWASEANPLKRVVSCQDCHMASFSPLHAPNSPKQRSHQFLGPTKPLHRQVDQADSRTRDRFLQEAIAIRIKNLAANQTLHDNLLAFDVEVESKGIGHHFPTGLTADRELWLEVTVSTKNGRLLYANEILRDRAHPESGEPLKDGSLDDEDLPNETYAIHPETLLPTDWKSGPGYNLRPLAKRGVALFQDAFLKKTYSDSWRKVPFFFQANSVEHGRTLPPLATARIAQALPLTLDESSTRCQTAVVVVSLKYRSFSPRILRSLKRREPSLLNREHIGRNRVTTVAFQTAETDVCLNRDLAEALASTPTQGHSFSRNGSRWKLFPEPKSYQGGKEACERSSCHLPTIEEFKTLALEGYSPVPGDNFDLARAHFWSSDLAHESGGKIFQSTYSISPRDKTAGNTGSSRADTAALSALPTLCLCGVDQ